MKQFILILLGVWFCASAIGQTYYQWRMTYPQTNYLDIPSNTLCQVIAIHSIDPIYYNAQVKVSFPEQTNTFIQICDAKSANALDKYLGWPVIGPARLKVSGALYSNMSYVAVELRPVNVGELPSLVLPAGRAARVTLETSTNLVTWQTITNATYSPTESHRFFRTQLRLE